MYRVSISIVGVDPVRRSLGGTKVVETTPELSVTAQSPTGLEALDKAIRILTSERDALLLIGRLRDKDHTFAELKAAIDEEEDEPEDDDEPVLTGRQMREAKARARMDED